MSNLMARGMSMLNRQLAVAGSNALGIVCTPNDGGGSVTLTNWIGTRGRIVADANTGDFQSRHEHDTRDFTGPVASLTRSGAPFLPAEHMRFVEIIDGTSYTYEAIPVNGEPAWDWCDAEKTRVRVRCKRQVV